MTSQDIEPAEVFCLAEFLADEMRLPAGKTCGDCFHIRRCKAMFGHVETDTYCDWSPSRFRRNT